MKPQQIFSRVTDVIREMFPQTRTSHAPMPTEEAALAVHLRGNDALYQSLCALLESRIGGRANLPEPSDPLVCKSWVARDRELQWLLRRLEYIHKSPVNFPADDVEPPDA